MASTDFGGLSVAELTQALKDGILDPNTLRAALASDTNPLATLVDAAALAGYGQLATYTKTSGNITLGDNAAVPTDVPDGGGFAEIVQAATVPHTALLYVQASVGMANGSGRASVGLGVKLNGAPLVTGYALFGGLGGSSIMVGGFATQGVEGAGVNNIHDAASFIIPIALIAGANTIRLQYLKDSAAGAAFLFASAASPLKLSLLHKG